MLVTRVDVVQFSHIIYIFGISIGILFPATFTLLGILVSDSPYPLFETMWNKKYITKDV
jgi:hypothetical protein